MPDTRPRDIIRSVYAMLQAIAPGNGYHTDAGARVTIWRGSADAETDAFPRIDLQYRIQPVSSAGPDHSRILELTIVGMLRLADETPLDRLDRVEELAKDIHSAVLFDDLPVWCGPVRAGASSPQFPRDARTLLLIPIAYLIPFEDVFGG